MQVDAETKILVVGEYIGCQQREALPIDFGIGHRNMAVKLLGIRYGLAEIFFVHAESLYSPCFAVCLSENPAHLTNPPTEIQMIESKSTYAFHNFIAYYPTTGEINLYGLIRPFRQILCLDNDLDTQVTGKRIRVEIYYQAVELSLEESGALARQKGAYRRT